MTETLIRVEVADGIAVLTLNRPEARNALHPPLIAAILETVADADRRADVAAIVLTGADPAFCAGVDLKYLAANPSTGSADAMSGSLDPLPPHTTPVIGAINGATVTGGLELAIACDFLVASERATFADTHARVGVMPGGGLTARLPRLVGVNRARQMSFTGDFIDARRAYDWGLVNEVVPHDRLLPRALEIGRAIASIPPANVSELRAMYEEVTALAGPAAWDRQEAWARAWMRDGFDRGRLAEQRAAIVARGSSQQAPPA